MLTSNGLVCRPRREHVEDVGAFHGRSGVSKRVEEERVQAGGSAGQRGGSSVMAALRLRRGDHAHAQRGVDDAGRARPPASSASAPLGRWQDAKPVGPQELWPMAACAAWPSSPALPSSATLPSHCEQPADGRRWSRRCRPAPARSARPARTWSRVHAGGEGGEVRHWPRPASTRISTWWQRSAAAVLPAAVTTRASACTFGVAPTGPAMRSSMHER